MTSEKTENPDVESPAEKEDLEAEQQAQLDADAKERRLDEAIEMTFPASDPLAI